MAKQGTGKKISTTIPKDLLAAACKYTGATQTGAIIAGLQELILSYKRRRALTVRGKVRIDLDLDRIRERVRL